MNHFLRSHRVVTVGREFVSNGDFSYWCFCVEYLEQGTLIDNSIARKADRIDYKDVLSESEFAVFSRLRELRKDLARQEGLAVYAICTNEQLSAMIQNRCLSIGQLKKISGFGEAKASKYGKAILEILQPYFEGVQNETCGSVNNQNNRSGQSSPSMAEND